MGVQSFNMTGSTRKNTLQIPAGLSLQRNKPEPAADFDSAALHLNPQRLEPPSLLATESLRLHYKDFTAKRFGRSWCE